MHRASTGDLEKPCALIVRQRAAELETPLDAIQVALFRLAFSAIDGVDPEIPHLHSYVLERPTFASRVQRNRH
jgi:hypothetical protein